jgi:hypothetical protein
MDKMMLCTHKCLGLLSNKNTRQKCKFLNWPYLLLKKSYPLQYIHYLTLKSALYANKQIFIDELKKSEGLSTLKMATLASTTSTWGAA